MKTNLDKLFKTNEKMEQEGIFFEISDGVRFRIKRFDGSSAAVKSLMAKYYKPYAKTIEMGGMSDDKQNEILIRVFVESCMIDWQGIEINGEEKDFEPELAIKLLTSLPVMTNNLVAYASDFKNFREDLGNY
jgi:hypothetical protein